MPKHHKHTAHTRLGQHFLTRPEIAGRVADAVTLGSEDTVLEIGPGHGILTRELLMRAGKVVAVEKDPTLVAELREVFADEIAAEKLVLIEEDIRDFDPSSCSKLKTINYKLVSNIPYYLTGYIIRKFLTTKKQPHAMALLVQKEVAERMVARDGKESLLSISIKVYGTPRYIRTVKAGSFSPPPKVDSAVLSIDTISRDVFANTEEEEHFFALLRAGYANKRKLLANNLGLANTEPLTTCGTHEKARAEELSPEQWLCVAELTPHQPCQK